MKREIGSDFWFKPEDIDSKVIKELDPSIFGCCGSDYVWLSTCRSAISLVIDTIEHRDSEVRKIVCLPAFTCHTVYQPFINNGYKVVMIPVEKDLTISAEKAIAVIKDVKPGIILFHNYFGFDTITESKQIIEMIKAIGAIVIEDLTQSMYSQIERLPADYFVGSIRKWCGVVDGGFAVCKDGYFMEHPTDVDKNLEHTTCKASELKYQYMNGESVDKTEFLCLYGKAKDFIDNQEKIYAINPISKLIQSNLNVEEMSDKRRENFETLLNGIRDIDEIRPVFSSNGTKNVPLYFPIICKDRARLQKLLVKHDIYAPIIWPKEYDCPLVNDDANYLYENMLCIPIDQRYDTDDMQRIISVLNNNSYEDSIF